MASKFSTPFFNKSPINKEGYEGGGDIGGQYIPTSHMYTDMFNKIGKAAMDIDARNKSKDAEDKRKEDFSRIGTDGYTQAMYDSEYQTKPQKYKENKDGTFSLIKT